MVKLLDLFNHLMRFGFYAEEEIAPLLPRGFLRFIDPKTDFVTGMFAMM